MKAIVGIDISKKDFTVALIINSKIKDFTVALIINSKIKKNKLTNNNEGFLELKQWLIASNVIEVKACMEATGSYGEKLADFLYHNNYEVSVVNSSCIKAFARSKLSKHKTDEVDSVLIANYASINELIQYKPRNPVIKELKALYHCLQSLKEQYVQIKNQLEHQEVMPESVISIWKATAKSVNDQIREAESSIEKLIENHDSLNKDLDNLQSIPGIGRTTSIAIIAEIPEITSFRDARQLAAFLGLTPCHRTSGSSVRFKARISKMGSSILRKALYFPAISAKNHNPILKEFAKRLKNKGKHTMAIIMAVMRKLVYIIFGILKNKNPFDPNFLVA